MSKATFAFYCQKAELPADGKYDMMPEVIPIEVGEETIQDIFLALVLILTGSNRTKYGEITLCRHDGEHDTEANIGRSMVLYALPVKSLMERVKTAHRQTFRDGQKHVPMLLRDLAI